MGAENRLKRREFLKVAGLGFLGAVGAACKLRGSTETPVPTEVPSKKVTTEPTIIVKSTNTPVSPTAEVQQVTPTVFKVDAAGGPYSPEKEAAMEPWKKAIEAFWPVWAEAGVVNINRLNEGNIPLKPYWGTDGSVCVLVDERYGKADGFSLPIVNGRPQFVPPEKIETGQSILLLTKAGFIDEAKTLSYDLGCSDAVWVRQMAGKPETLLATIGLAGNWEKTKEALIMTAQDREYTVGNVTCNEKEMLGGVLALNEAQPELLAGFHKDMVEVLWELMKKKGVAGGVWAGGQIPQTASEFYKLVMQGDGQVRGLYIPEGVKEKYSRNDGFYLDLSPVEGKANLKTIGIRVLSPEETKSKVPDPPIQTLANLKQGVYWSSVENNQLFMNLGSMNVQDEKILEGEKVTRDVRAIGVGGHTPTEDAVAATQQLYLMKNNMERRRYAQLPFAKDGRKYIFDGLDFWNVSADNAKGYIPKIPEQMLVVPRE